MTSVPLPLELPTDDRFSSSVIRDLLSQARRPDVISLAGGLPAAEALPIERFERAVSEALVTHGPRALQYGLSGGEPELLEALATAHDTSTSRLIVTAGSQQALDLLAHVLTIRARGDGARPVAAIDDPGYVGAVQVLATHDYDLLGIPVDADGLDVDVLEARLRAGARPTLCYTNPAFQNPSGATLSPERARRLVDLAEEFEFVVIADDPYVELHLDGERPGPVPPSPWVVRLGSSSKTLAPGLRIGWAEGDEGLIGRLTLAKQAADLQTATVNQLAVATLMQQSDWWPNHLDALRDDYRQRRAELSAAVERHLSGATITPQGGGFFLWVDLDRPDLDMMELLPQAVDAGMAFVPGSAFAVDADHPGVVRLSYSNGDPSTFDEAVRRLTTVL